MARTHSDDRDGYRRRPDHHFFVQPPAPDAPITVPSAPEVTPPTPGKVTVPHELPCFETRSIEFRPLCISAYARSPRTMVKSWPGWLASHAGAGPSVASYSLSTAQTPLMRTARVPSSKGCAMKLAGSTPEASSFSSHGRLPLGAGSRSVQ